MKLVPILGAGLSIAGLVLVAFSETLNWVYVGAYFALAGVIILVLYMVLHREGWEK